MDGSGGWGSLAGRDTDGVEAVYGVATVGRRGAGVMGVAHVRVSFARCDDVHRDFVAGEAVREDNVAYGVERAGESRGGGGEHQSTGVVPGDRGDAADLVDR